MTLISSIDLDGVNVDGLVVSRGELLEHYSNVLGTPDRWTMPGAPPPVGHRNNVIHFYDQLGFFLREHHATRLISSIVFLLDLKDAVFPTAMAYSGKLAVCGVSVFAGMPFTQFSDLCGQTFKPHLGHAWYLDGEKISIQFEVQRQSAGGEPRREVITQLAVGFEGAHRPRHFNNLR